VRLYSTHAARSSRDRSVVELLSAQMEMPGCIERHDPLNKWSNKKSMRRRQPLSLGTEFCVAAAGVIYLFCCTIHRQVCVALTFPQNHNNSIYNELRWLIRLMHASQRVAFAARKLARARLSICSPLLSRPPPPTPRSPSFGFFLSVNAQWKNV
jgi:hypothetical protein